MFETSTVPYGMPVKFSFTHSFIVDRTQGGGKYWERKGWGRGEAQRHGKQGNATLAPYKAAGVELGLHSLLSPC